jgi:Tfp pilus assembly protein PilP
MRTFFLFGIMATTAALLGACGEGVPNADTGTPAATTAATPAKTVAAAKPETYTAPFVAGNTALIEPTDKTKKQEELNKKFESAVSKDKNRDPFAIIPGSVPIPAAAKGPNPLASPPVSSRIRISAPKKVAPEPLEAQSVTVTGIVEVANNLFAIISVPGEPTSRYVRAGQRIAGNKVLVKRIEMLGTPRVILEQFNIEVPRSVGQVVAVAPVGPGASPVAAPAAATSDNSGVIVPPAPIVPRTVNPAGVANTPPREVYDPNTGTTKTP